MTIRSWMSSIMGSIEPEKNWSYLPLNYKKLLNSTSFALFQTSTDMNHLALNSVKMYVTIRSRMRLIMGSIRLE